MRGLAGVRLDRIGEEAMRQTLAMTDGADLAVVPGAWTGCRWVGAGAGGGGNLITNLNKLSSFLNQ